MTICEVLERIQKIIRMSVGVESHTAAVAYSNIATGRR